jgi:HEAT repeat protein
MAFYLIRVIQRVQIQRWTALLADRDGELSKRVKAARILAEICDKRDTLLVEPLLDALNDEENEIRCYAIEALSGIADRRAVEPICGALQDGDVDVRRLAAKALGKLGDTQAVKPLLKVLKDKKENMKVRKHAAEALGEIGAEKAVIPLVEFLKEEEKPGPAVYISKPGSYESYGHKGSELYYPVRDALEAIGEQAGGW